MARLGTALGWPHYSAGWHATCTAGAPASAAGAAVALGLRAEKIAVAMALAVPAAGGVQRAFGTDAKSLQVGFAVDAGIRAARLAAAGAQADPEAVDMWLGLVGGDPAAVDPSGPAVPNGLAVKLYPCCYALQRPISALTEFASKLDPAAVRRIVLRTPEATVVPLIHHQPESGLQGKFSLEYAAAAALLDAYPGFGSFTDAAVRRDAARRLVSLVETKLDPGGDWLLDGELAAEIHTGDGAVLRTSQQFPPGSPERPPTPAQLQAKLADCVRGLDTDPGSWTWANAADVLRRWLPSGPRPAEQKVTQHG
jgi:2-methylcitrate dehydratase PrpD